MRQHASRCGRSWLGDRPGTGPRREERWNPASRAPTARSPAASTRPSATRRCERVRFVESAELDHDVDRARSPVRYELQAARRSAGDEVEHAEDEPWRKGLGELGIGARQAAPVAGSVRSAKSNRTGLRSLKADHRHEHDRPVRLVAHHRRSSTTGDGGLDGGRVGRARR